MMIHPQNCIQHYRPSPFIRLRGLERCRREGDKTSWSSKHHLRVLQPPPQASEAGFGGGTGGFWGRLPCRLADQVLLPLVESCLTQSKASQQQVEPSSHEAIGAHAFVQPVDAFRTAGMDGKGKWGCWGVFGVLLGCWGVFGVLLGCCCHPILSNPIPPPTPFIQPIDALRSARMDGKGR